VPVFELNHNKADGRYYLVMEYVHGQTAQAVWEKTLELGAALPIDYSLTVASAAASALYYAHSRQMRDGKSLAVVHRDVTLSNLMVGYDGTVKLIDFGIAKAANRRHGTQVGYVKGKIGYLAPEQIAGKRIDHRTDIFALGIVLYELTTMHRPFREASDHATIDRIKRGLFVPPSELVPNYPRGLELIVQKALKVNPDERFQDAEQLRRELEALGHRQKLILGDAAIIEVMVQLYDERDEPWRAPVMKKRAATDLAIPIEGATPPRGTSRGSVRSLRAATELADQMEIQVTEHGEDDGHVTDPLPVVKEPPATPAHATATEFPEPITTPARPSYPADKEFKTGTRPITTLSPAGSRSALVSWLMAGAVVAVGFVVLLVIIDALRSRTAEAERPDTTPIAPPPRAAKTAVEPPKQVTTVKPATPDPKLPAETTTVRVSIKSSPADATVLLDGQKIGHTPYEGDVPVAPGPHALKVRKPGYRSVSWNVRLDGPEIKKEIPLKPD